MNNKETSVVCLFPASPHSLLVSFPNLHNINSSARRGFQEHKPTTRSLRNVGTLNSTLLDSLARALWILIEIIVDPGAEDGDFCAAVLCVVNVLTTPFGLAVMNPYPSGLILLWGTGRKC